MLFSLIFGVLALVLVGISLGHPKAAEQPMLRIGGICMAVALGAMAVSFLING